MDRITPGVIAVVIGAVLAILVFVPFVFVSYRRRGGITFWRTVGWAALLVSSIAILTYTTLPAPDSMDYECRGVQLDPLGDFRAIIAEQADGGSLLANAALQVVVFNVIFFMPLGFLLRALFRFGVARAALVGFAVSLLVETTQLTGIWGIYPCAYRLFSVGDLMTNTTGAVLGSLVALVVLRGRRDSTVVSEPRGVRAGRRVLGMACDVIVSLLLSLVVALGIRLLQVALGGPVIDALDETAQTWIGTGVAVVAQLATVLATGSTIGEHAVQLRGRGGWRPHWFARVVRTFAGFAGVLVLDAVGHPVADAATLALVVATVVMIFTTRAHRGLALVTAGMTLEDARDTSSTHDTSSTTT